jgi:hypothetical protein
VKTKAGVVAYRYAPIESIVEQVKAPLQANGFSYSTNMELLESGVKVSVKVTHSAGHSELTQMTVPLGTKTDIMSASQVVAAAQTFAKRYAFCNAFGILTGDEDNDAQDTGDLSTQRNAAKQTQVSASQLKTIASIAKEKGYTKEDVVAKCTEMGFKWSAKSSLTSLQRVNQKFPERMPALTNRSCRLKAYR